MMRFLHAVIAGLFLLNASIEVLAQNGVTDIDGNFYQSVIIGSQEWMASDLRTTRYSNGDTIFNAQETSNWFLASEGTIGAYCILNNDTVYANQRGKIYNGYVIYDGRNVCPSGWKVPTDGDFGILESFIGIPAAEIGNTGIRGETQLAGVKLKSTGILQFGTGLWDLSSTNPGTDIYGWNGYPHGARLAGGDFCCDNGSVGYLVKDSTNSGVIRRELSFNVDGIIRSEEPMANGHQIRCLKDPCFSVIHDTIVVYDTVLVAVTDTLVINVNTTGVSFPDISSIIRIFPNPASTHVTIDYGDFVALNGYQLSIINSLGQQVFFTGINQQTDYLSLAAWGGNGLYFVHVIDVSGNIVDIRKIVLQ